MLHFPQNLKLIRLVADKTQPEFGKMFNATKAMMVSYEKGKAGPDSLFLSRLSSYSGVPESDLMNKSLKEQDLKIKKVEKLENGQIEEPLAMATMRDLAASNKVIAESNKALAESNKSLARSNEQLVEMVKPIAGVQSESPATVDSKFSTLLELIADVGSGKRWKSKNEAVAELSNFVHGTGKKKKVVGTHGG